MNWKQRVEIISLGVFGTILGGIILYYLNPILPETLSSMMFVLYSVMMTLIAIAFGMALVIVSWRTLRSLWRLKYTDHRRKIWEKVREWPTCKRDALTAMAVTWSTAIVVPIVVLALAVPEGQLAGHIPLGALQAIVFLAMAPTVLLMYWYFCDLAKHLWLEWKTSTHNGRIRIGATVLACLMMFALMVWGDISGWDDRAWFAN